MLDSHLVVVVRNAEGMVAHQAPVTDGNITFYPNSHHQHQTPHQQGLEQDTSFWILRRDLVSKIMFCVGKDFNDVVFLVDKCPCLAQHNSHLGKKAFRSSHSIAGSGV